MSDREILKREKRKRITGHTEDTHQTNDAVWHWNVIKVQRSIVAVSTGILEAQIQITVKFNNILIKANAAKTPVHSQP